MLNELVGGLHRLGLVEPITATAIITQHYIEVIAAAAHAPGVSVHRVAVRQPRDYGKAFETMARAGDNATIVISNPLSLSNRAEIGKSARSQAARSSFAPRAAILA